MNNADRASRVTSPSQHAVDIYNPQYRMYSIIRDDIRIPRSRPYAYPRISAVIPNRAAKSIPAKRNCKYAMMRPPYRPPNCRRHPMSPVAIEIHVITITINNRQRSKIKDLIIPNCPRNVANSNQSPA